MIRFWEETRATTHTFILPIKKNVAKAPSARESYSDTKIHAIKRTE